MHTVQKSKGKGSRGNNVGNTTKQLRRPLHYLGLIPPEGRGHDLRHCFSHHLITRQTKHISSSTLEALYAGRAIAEDADGVDGGGAVHGPTIGRGTAGYTLEQVVTT